MLNRSSILARAAIAALAIAALAPTTASAKYQAPHPFPSSAPHTGRSTGGICWIRIGNHLFPSRC